MPLTQILQKIPQKCIDLSIRPQIQYPERDLTSLLPFSFFPCCHPSVGARASCSRPPLPVDGRSSWPTHISYDFCPTSLFSQDPCFTNASHLLGSWHPSGEWVASCQPEFGKWAITSALGVREKDWCDREAAEENPVLVPGAKTAPSAHPQHSLISHIS